MNIDFAEIDQAKTFIRILEYNFRDINITETSCQMFCYVQKLKLLFPNSLGKRFDVFTFK